MAARDERRIAAPAEKDPPVQVIFVRMPAKGRDGEPRRQKAPRRSRLVRLIGKRRNKMIKLAIATVLALAVYVALGVVAPISGSTAVFVTALGTFGALTYKGIAAMAALVAVARS